MNAGSDGCGPLFDLYAAARADEVEAVEHAWAVAEPTVAALDYETAGRLEAAVEAGDVDAVRALAARLLYVDEELPLLRGAVATAVGALLFWFGFVASYVLFYGADSREAVVGRLRRAYRTVGVDVTDTETVDGVERTVFRCPYRNLGATRYGKRRVCHDVLDRVDDGYVAFLAEHRDLEYDRPRRCAASECCHSEVVER